MNNILSNKIGEFGAVVIRSFRFDGRDYKPRDYIEPDILQKTMAHCIKALANSGRIKVLTNILADDQETSAIIKELQEENMALKETVSDLKERLDQLMNEVADSNDLVEWAVGDLAHHIPSGENGKISLLSPDNDEAVIDLEDGPKRVSISTLREI